MAGHDQNESCPSIAAASPVLAPLSQNPSIVMPLAAVLGAFFVGLVIDSGDSACRCRRRWPPFSTAHSARNMPSLRPSTERSFSPPSVSASFSPTRRTSPTSAARGRSRWRQLRRPRWRSRRPWRICRSALAYFCRCWPVSRPARVWGGICGILKVRVGTNEVISSLLLTFIGVWLLYWSIQSVDLLRQPMTNTRDAAGDARDSRTRQNCRCCSTPARSISVLIIVVILAVLVELILHKKRVRREASRGRIERACVAARRHSL